MYTLISNRLKPQSHSVHALLQYIGILVRIAHASIKHIEISIYDTPEHRTMKARAIPVVHAMPEHIQNHNVYCTRQYRT